MKAVPLSKAYSYVKKSFIKVVPLSKADYYEKKSFLDLVPLSKACSYVKNSFIKESLFPRTTLMKKSFRRSNYPHTEPTRSASTD